MRNEGMRERGHEKLGFSIEGKHILDDIWLVVGFITDFWIVTSGWV